MEKKKKKESFGFKLSLVKCVNEPAFFGLAVGKGSRFCFFWFCEIGTCAASKPFTLSTPAMPSMILFFGLKKTLTSLKEFYFSFY